MRILRTLVLSALAALLLAGCLGWAQGPGPHRGRWDNPPADRPYSRCTDPQSGQPVGPPCPYRG